MSNDPKYFWVVFDPAVTPFAPIVKSGYTTKQEEVDLQAMAAPLVLLEVDAWYKPGLYQMNTSVSPPVVVPV